MAVKEFTQENPDYAGTRILAEIFMSYGIKVFVITNSGTSVFFRACSNINSYYYHINNYVEQVEQEKSKKIETLFFMPYDILVFSEGVKNGLVPLEQAFFLELVPIRLFHYKPLLLL